MTPPFMGYLIREFGGARSPGALMRQIFLRPFWASSFAGFWRQWNPAYRYILLFHVYAPLKRFCPRWLAAWLTFVVCGFLFHDAPFLHGRQWFRGEPGFPEGTLLFAIFGFFSLVSEALHFDLSRYPPSVRVTSNLGWLLLSLTVYFMILARCG